MDGYAICMNLRRDVEKIKQHAETHRELVRLLEECVPEGSTLISVVLSCGSQIQPPRPLRRVT
jgi:hypothetical protein